MPILTINHKTEYRYAHPVTFGEHEIMLRPLPGHDLHILAHDLAISPEPMRLRWIHDVFGNSVAIATFDERADTLTFISTATVEAHRRNIMRKLGLHTIAELTKYAIRKGLTSL